MENRPCPILNGIITAIRFGVLLLRAAVESKEPDHPPPLKPAPLTKEEVDAMLAQSARLVPDARDYRTSIVDLLKVLQQDASFTARKQLASELGYQGGAYEGTAEQNIWLHGQVMRALASREFGAA